MVIKHYIHTDIVYLENKITVRGRTFSMSETNPLLYFIMNIQNLFAKSL